jgi:hypothetical protein
MAQDVVRACRLREGGYRVFTSLIPAEITLKNRLLLAEPMITVKGGTDGTAVEDH